MCRLHPSFCGGGFSMLNLQSRPHRISTSSTAMYTSGRHRGAGQGTGDCLRQRPALKYAQCLWLDGFRRKAFFSIARCLCRTGRWSAAVSNDRGCCKPSTGTVHRQSTAALAAYATRMNEGHKGTAHLAGLGLLVPRLPVCRKAVFEPADHDPKKASLEPSRLDITAHPAAG